MAVVKARYIAWREGRPRFVPGPALRKLGYSGEDLRHGKTGPWFDADETIAWAKAKATEIDQALEAGKKPKAPPVPKGERVKDLLEDFFKSADFLRARDLGGYSKKTRDDYLEKAQAIYYKPVDVKALARGEQRAAELISLAPARTLKPARVKQFFEQLERERGPFMALGVIKVLSAAYRWARLAPGWELESNPCRELDLPKPELNVRVFKAEHVRLLVECADKLGKFSIGDCIMLGLDTGQRQSDRLEHEDGGHDTHGRRIFRQSKTGATVAVKETPELHARLTDATKRRAELALKFGQKPEKRPKTVIVSEATGEAYVQDTYQHEFQTVRDALVVGAFYLPPEEGGYTNGKKRNDEGMRLVVPSKAFLRNWGEVSRARVAGFLKNIRPEDWLIAPNPELADELGELSDRILRHTAITRMAMSGSTALQISRVSGHKVSTVHAVIEHYLGSDAEIADDVIDRLVDWKRKEGLAV
jgi:hypothetical protein